MNLYYLTLGPVFAALLYSVYVIWGLHKLPSGESRMREISEAIRKGSAAYLHRQYRTVAAVAVILALALWYFFDGITALGFLAGAAASAAAGYTGMNIAVRSNVKVAEAAKSGLAPALKIAFRAGSVTGFLVVALGLLSISVFYFATGNLRSLVALGFGASLISVFARLGGGIYTKAADVGADLVGKVEAGIPEDDPRNPAVIADNVGDNVGDCAGMAADLFETYVVTLVAAMILGNLIFPGVSLAVNLPLIVGGVAILASVLGAFFVKLGKSKSIMKALYKGLAAASILAVIGFYLLIGSGLEGMVDGGQLSYGYNGLRPAGNILNSGQLFLPMAAGILVTVFMVLITDYYTAKRYRPVQEIAKASSSGHGTNIIIGLAMGMESTLLPIILISAGILLTFEWGGLYGVAMAAVAMLSSAGIIVAIDSFGPITDNAGGIAEMTDQPEQVREVTDALDAVGNTTKAVTKGYAIASAGLAAVVLFSSYTEELDSLGSKIIFELSNPYVLVGLFLGAAVPYIFASIAMRAVGKTAGAVVKEVRRQFKEIPGLMEGKTKPDYGRAVDLVTKAALKEMILPALLPVIAVLLVGFLLDAAALGGFLIGSIISGLFLAISMTSGGAAWDNAKKYIEDGNLGGKGSETHKAAVTGDTVGDPYKDTAGPAINPLIKVINIVALLIVKFLR